MESDVGGVVDIEGEDLLIDEAVELAEDIGEEVMFSVEVVEEAT